jgi:hypothetical protein
MRNLPTSTGHHLLTVWLVFSSFQADSRPHQRLEIWLREILTTSTKPYQVFYLPNKSIYSRHGTPPRFILTAFDISKKCVQFLLYPGLVLFQTWM